MSIYFYSVAPDVNVKDDWMETGLWFGFGVKNNGEELYIC